MKAELKEDNKGLPLAAGDVLTYWFSFELWKPAKFSAAPGSFYDELWQTRWFAKEANTPVVDAYVEGHFGGLVEEAIRGECDHWSETPYGTLALIIVLDQFSRNLFRNSPKAFAQDEKALKICLEALDKKFDEEIPLITRTQLYMPLVHSENFEMQKLSVQKYKALLEQATSLNAFIFERFVLLSDKHYSVISTFGRYPERNKNLNRKSTQAEHSYLQESFLQLKYTETY
eukprot:TRINITY_DN20950_c0_g1_i1.p1 TRINITY_DN20950_c0_g1~~TRINITY_DN20950_c0_g1_i1.p1  ORF type:complete len:230 (-),score=60.04 TRINITY_DN20950_c0_g1_i1:15-704(-)